MTPYEKLDAWRACHSLTLAVYELTQDSFQQDPRLIGRLRHTAIRSAARLAFGAGTRNKVMFRRAAARSGGHLTDFGYQLSLARIMAIVPEKACIQLDALRGRAAFYATQLLSSLLVPPHRDGK